MRSSGVAKTGRSLASETRCLFTSGEKEPYQSSEGQDCHPEQEEVARIFDSLDLFHEFSWRSVASDCAPMARGGLSGSRRRAGRAGVGPARLRQAGRHAIRPTRECYRRNERRGIRGGRYSLGKRTGRLYDVMEGVALFACAPERDHHHCLSLSERCTNAVISKLPDGTTRTPLSKRESLRAFDLRRRS